MTEEEFRTLLKDYDWWYSMSDDMRIWKVGFDTTIRIQNICSTNPKLNTIYQEERKKMGLK